MKKKIERHLFIPLWRRPWRLCRQLEKWLIGNDRIPDNELYVFYQFRNSKINFTGFY